MVKLQSSKVERKGHEQWWGFIKQQQQQQQHINGGGGINAPLAPNLKTLDTFHFPLTCATLSSQVSSVSQAILRSDSLNSYFLVHPWGAYLSLSWMMTWNHASRKYRRARSWGSLHMRAAGTVLKVRMRLAFTPRGGSNVKIREARRRLTGTWSSK